MNKEERTDLLSYGELIAENFRLKEKINKLQLENCKLKLRIVDEKDYTSIYMQGYEDAKNKYVKKINKIKEIFEDENNHFEDGCDCEIIEKVIDEKYENE